MKWWWNDDEMMMKWWWNDDEIVQCRGFHSQPKPLRDDPRRGSRHGAVLSSTSVPRTWRHVKWKLGNTWRLSENSVPLNPMVLLISIPMKNGYFIGNIPNIFRQTHMAVVRISFANDHSSRITKMTVANLSQTLRLSFTGVSWWNLSLNLSQKKIELREKKNFQGVSCWQFKILTWTFRTTPTWEIHGNTMEYDITWQCNELEISGKWLNHWFWGICAHVGTNPWQTNMSRQHLETSLSRGTLYCSFETFLLWLRIPRATMHPGL